MLHLSPLAMRFSSSDLGKDTRSRTQNLRINNLYLPHGDAVSYMSLRGVSAVASYEPEI